MTALAEQRLSERYGVNAPYTAVRVGAAGGAGFPLEGHAYDISATGLRFELDEVMKVGQPLSLELLLPGAGGWVRLAGRVVRLFDEIDDPGPRRMAIHVDSFEDDSHRERLVGHLDRGYLMLA
ncbi:MAG: PilZ domain-containing protein [Planctomycetes bacterium]|nr:PilZ domain-containing protein [Planctomycetota bacterium]